MTANYGYTKLVVGRLKIGTIAMLGVIVILSYLSYFLSEYTTKREEHRPDFIKNEIRSLWAELFLMGVSSVSFVLSIINLWLHCRSLEFYYKTSTAYYDFVYHMAFGFLTAVSGVFFIISAVQINEINCTEANGCQQFSLKIAAGGVALFSGVVIGCVGSVVLTNRKDVEREGMMMEKANAIN